MIKTPSRGRGSAARGPRPDGAVSSIPRLPRRAGGSRRAGSGWGGPAPGGPGGASARARPRPGVTGWAFAAVTQAPALLAVAWLVPGIGILLARELSPLPMTIIFVPLA